jgi:hypothetical protein
MKIVCQFVNELKLKRRRKREADGGNRVIFKFNLGVKPRMPAKYKLTFFKQKKIEYYQNSLSNIIFKINNSIHLQITKPFLHVNFYTAMYPFF